MMMPAPRPLGALALLAAPLVVVVALLTGVLLGLCARRRIGRWPETTATA
jgi:hypothetical protein